MKQKINNKLHLELDLTHKEVRDILKDSGISNNSDLHKEKLTSATKMFFVTLFNYIEKMDSPKLQLELKKRALKNKLQDLKYEMENLSKEISENKSQNKSKELKLIDELSKDDLKDFFSKILNVEKDEILLDRLDENKIGVKKKVEVESQDISLEQSGDFNLFLETKDFENLNNNKEIKINFENMPKFNNLMIRKAK